MKLQKALRNGTVTMTSYNPTPVEFRCTRIRSEEVKLSGDGVFATLQGEGVTAGRPSVFARLQNCNLHCGMNGDGWQCDTWYTWDQTTPEYWQGTELVTVGGLVDRIQDAWDGNFADTDLPPNLVITGGEPLLQQDKVIDIMSRLPDWDFEIETNGTIAPKPELDKAQINCSPKLASSGNSLVSRRRIEALRGIEEMPNHWFKFVISGDTDLVEVVELMKEINDGDFRRVLLMGEGSISENLVAQETRLNKAAEELGCLMTSRNHIFWFGDKRRT